MNPRNWTDSAGVVHDLTREKRLTIGEAATRLRCSIRTIRRRILSGEIGAVCRQSAQQVEIYECAIADFIARKTSTPATR